MFVKPFQVKSNCQLKGSARKKFRADLLKVFPSISEDAFNEYIPSKEAVSMIKVFTHSKEVVHVYSVENGPIAFEREGQLFPALYLLWRFPDLVHTFTTWPPVLSKIKNGADLMLPGVVLPGGISVNSYGKLTKGDCVVVNLTSNRAPVAVGVAAHSSFDMYMCGGRGKCVNILHSVGDNLWSHGAKFNIPELGPPPGLDLSVSREPEDSTDEEDDDDDDSESKSHSDSDDSNDDGLNREDEMTTGMIKMTTEDKSIEGNNAETLTNSTVPPIADSDAEVMDKLLRFCFLKALKTTARKIDLPILTSNFFKVHMLPACPPGQSVDLKKSSYKKLGKFLDEMAKEKIIVQKEMSKGVLSITSVNHSHEALLTFLDLEAVVDENAHVLAGHARVGKCMCGLVHTEQMYTVTPAVLPIFSLQLNRVGDQLTTASVRNVLRDYIKVKSLETDADKSNIQCDEVLAKAIMGLTPSKPLILSWEDLLKRMMARMLDTSALPPPKVHKEDKGKLTPIDIQTATRTGNKKVTLISNLELYGVDVAEFAKECQKGVAASTTVNPLPGRKGVQLQVQGNQVIFVSQLLHNKYQVPMANMRGLDKAPKVKGQKKAQPKPKPKPK